MGSTALPFILPAASKTAARALPVPTSTPTKNFSLGEFGMEKCLIPTGNVASFSYGIDRVPGPIHAPRLWLCLANEICHADPLPAGPGDHHPKGYSQRKSEARSLLD